MLLYNRIYFLFYEIPLHIDKKKNYQSNHATLLALESKLDHVHEKKMDYPYIDQRFRAIEWLETIDLIYSLQVSFLA